VKRFLVVFAIVLAIGATAAVAQPVTPHLPRSAGVAVGELYETNTIWQIAIEQPATPMPMPQQPSASSTTLDSGTNPSTAFSDASTVGRDGADFGKRGGAIVPISGGRFITPKMQADRAITKLIRRLD
jgi:hypothetical protein